MTNRAVHFLHIPKTGGTALISALAPFAAELRLAIHVHADRLSSIPLEDDVFFFLREPVSRFVSGFNSRLRCGRPRYSYPWTPAEAATFSRFTTPNELAEGLTSEEPAVARAAREAMEAVPFFNTGYAWWLGSIEELFARRERLVVLGLQSELAGDFEFLKQRLGLPASLELPSDDHVAHKSPPEQEKRLSEAGARAIERWYEADRAFYAAYRELRSTWYGLPS